VFYDLSSSIGQNVGLIENTEVFLEDVECIASQSDVG
jgi:hypothetical protein